MSNKLFVTGVVELDGYQSVFKESQFGSYVMAVRVEDEDLIAELEEDRAENLKYRESKLKNPKRKKVNLEPWEELDDGGYRLKFKWMADRKPVAVDSQGTPIKGEIPLYSGSRVKVAFEQWGYGLPDGITIGTKLVLKSFQVIKASGGNGVSDGGSMSPEAAAKVFGTSEGFRYDEANVSVEDRDDEEEDMPF